MNRLLHQGYLIRKDLRSWLKSYWKGSGRWREQKLDLISLGKRNSRQEDSCIARSNQREGSKYSSGTSAWTFLKSKGTVRNYWHRSVWFILSSERDQREWTSNHFKFSNAKTLALQWFNDWSLHIHKLYEGYSRRILKRAVS